LAHRGREKIDKQPDFYVKWIRKNLGLLGRGLIIKLTSSGPWNVETNGAEGFRSWDWYHLHLSEIYEKVSVLTHYGTCFETSIGGCAA
jgi:hypothetical protein